MATQNTTDVIANLSYTIIQTLRTEIKKDFNEIKDTDITLFSPVSDISQPPRLCLFLYQIVENPHMKNMPMERVEHTKLKYQPLILDLHYILMPYEAAANPHTGLTGSTIEEHRLMGKAMQVLYDKRSIKELMQWDSNSKILLEMPIKLAYNPVSLDDITKLWQSIHSRPYRPSVCYIAGPVVMESGKGLEQKSLTAYVDKNYQEKPSEEK